MRRPVGRLALLVLLPRAPAKRRLEAQGKRTSQPQLRFRQAWSLLFPSSCRFRMWRTQFLGHLEPYLHHMARILVEQPRPKQRAMVR